MMANYLLTKTTSEADPLELQKKMQQGIFKEWGSGIKSRQMFSGVYNKLDGTYNYGQLKALQQYASIPSDKTGVMNYKQIYMQAQLGRKEEEVTGGPAGMSMQKLQMLQDMVLKHGGAFATTAMAMERMLFAIANEGAPAADKALKTFAATLNNITKGKTPEQKEKQAGGIQAGFESQF
jgi:hypothetical protein